MRDRFLAFLVCPLCRSGLSLDPATRAGDDVRDGALRCKGCGRVYPIRAGIPRMVLGEEHVRATQRSFGSQWQKRRSGRYEQTTLFGLTAEEEERTFFNSVGMPQGALKGKSVLDGGCGSGRLTRRLAAYSGDVVGIDIAPTIEYVDEAGARPANLHLVQASLLEIPLADASFDVVWSMGVIHHTGDTPRAFANLARVVRPGGRMYIWVYSSQKLTLYKVIRDAMRISYRIPEDLLFALCYMMAPLLKLYHLAKFAVRRARGLPISQRERQEATIRTIAFELHDDLAPPHQTRHTPEEVIAWFRNAGFEHIEALGDVGVRGTKAPSRAAA